MAEHFLSPKLFFRDILVNFISGLAIGAVIGIFSGKLWLGLLSFLVIITIVFFSWFWNKYKRMIKLIISGSAGYYYSFDLEENPKVWQEAKKSFCYLGISFDSIMEYFRQWIEENPLLEYRLLLMKPDSDALKRQEAFQRGYDLDVKLESLPSETREVIDSAAQVTSERIRSSLSILKNITSSKESHIKIKLYDEFSPWWVYIIDDKKAYIGVLEKGKRGFLSPVIIMKKNDEYTNPFDAFRNNFERIWETAEEVK